VWWLIPVVLALGRLSMILGYIATPSLKKKKKKKPKTKQKSSHSLTPPTS
jgi:hypothetical protein